MEVTPSHHFKSNWGIHVVLVPALTITGLRALLFKNFTRNRLFLFLGSDLLLFLIFLIPLILEFVDCARNENNPESINILIYEFFGLFVILSSLMVNWFMNPLIFISVLIASGAILFNTFHQNTGTGVVKIVILACTQIIYWYWNEKKCTQWCQDNFESHKTLKDIFKIMPDGILAVSKAKTIQIHTPSLLNILGLDEIDADLTFNKVFKDLDIVLRSPQTDLVGSLNATTRPSTISENLYYEFQKSKNLNELQRLIWKNWDEIKSHFDIAFNPHFSSRFSFLVFEGEVTLPNKQQRIIENKFAMKTISKESCCLFIFSDLSEKPYAGITKEKPSVSGKFLESLADEINMPLNKVVNQLQSIVDSKETISNYAIESITPALTSAKYLSILTKNIKEFGKLTLTPLKLSYRNKSIVATIKEAIAFVEPEAITKRLRINFSFESLGIDTLARTDHSRLRLIVVNLLNVAIKFTFQGEIGVTLNKEDEYYSITVKDSSPGLEENEIKKLHSSSQNDNIIEGYLEQQEFGIGFFTSNALAKLLGPPQSGIQCESEKGKGTTYSLKIEDKNLAKITSSEEFPSLIASENRGDLKVGSYTWIQGRRMTIDLNTEPDSLNIKIPTSTFAPNTCTCPETLIVSEDKGFGAAVEAILQSVNSRGQFISNIKEVSQILNSRVKNKCSTYCKYFRTVFVDCDLNKVDGFELCLRIKQEVKKISKSRCQVIACSNHYESSFFSKEEIADLCIAKPIKKSLLLDMVKKSGF